MPGLLLPCLLGLAAPAGVVVSVSPAHLLVSMAEVQVEAPVLAHLSVVGIAGAGRVPASATDRFAVLELGGQLRAYPLGAALPGAHLALEALATRSTQGARRALGLGAGLLAGLQLDAQGLVLEANGGLGYRVERSEAADLRLTRSARGLRPILNINVGYRF